MSFQIVEMEDLSGPKAHIYSVVLDNEEETLLEQFFDEYRDNELAQAMYNKIAAMAKRTGCRREYFREGEGNFGDGVVALAIGNLRLYGIYFNQTLVLLGSGGVKNVRTYQEDPELNKKVKQIKSVASEINKAILEKGISISEDGELSD